MSSKKLPAAYWRTATESDYATEFTSQRTIFKTLAGIPEDAIRGMRAPYLQTSGNSMIRMAKDNNFVWDSSYSSQENNPSLWPYTFDYRSTAGCSIEPCPTASVPGFWEIPMIDWIDTNDTLCANVDSCYFPSDKEEALMLLRSNFLRHYNMNRAPFPINLRTNWFYNNGHYNLEALQVFLDEIEQLSDVYLVTYSQALQWVRTPVVLQELAASDMFGCNYFDRIDVCSKPNLCGYYNITYQPNNVEHQGDRYFQTCFQCPDEYPWVNNPTGDKVQNT